MNLMAMQPTLLLAEAAAGHGLNALSVVFFLLFVGITLGVTYWASQRTKTTAAFYTGGGITAVQNGFALAGDYMSAASFLGIVGMVSLSGFDGLIYSIGFLVGWPIVLFTIAEPLRNLGKYTFADVVAARLSQKPVRVASAFGTLSVVLFYLTAQMVGAGELIQLLFAIPYTWAVILVAAMMLVYVFFGGMAATTWVQIIKAGLLLGGASAMALMVLWQFGFNPLALFATAAEKAREADPNANPLAPVKLIKGPIDAVSLGLALMFGTAGLPHILMRFYTVRSAPAARSSVSYATMVIGYFYLLTFVLGFGAYNLVGVEAIVSEHKGVNMAAPLLARELGGQAFFGAIAAVAFATILAVVAGLALGGAAALSHDIWTNVVRHGKADDREQFIVARVSTVVLGVLAVASGIKFQGQNVAFMVGLAFSIAASANFPALILSIAWRPFTTAGAVACIATGTSVSLVLIGLSPAVYPTLFPGAEPIFPLGNPAIISMPLAFLVGIVVSLIAPEPKAQQGFEDLQRQLHFGRDDMTASH